MDRKLKIRALVVDDNSINRTIHRGLLKRLNVETIVAVENGEEAVDLHLSGNTFDLILMDLDMPIMNGIEATRKLRAMGIGSTIAGVSSRSVDDKVEEFMKAGLDDYQQKPLNFSKLDSILQKVDHNC